MGGASSRLSRDSCDKDSEYEIHGLTYWPGKVIPYKKWPAAILNKGTGGTYDEQTINQGGAKSKRAKMMARFQRLIETHLDRSDSSLHAAVTPQDTTREIVDKPVTNSNSCAPRAGEVVGDNESNKSDSKCDCDKLRLGGWRFSFRKNNHNTSGRRKKTKCCDRCGANTVKKNNTRTSTSSAEHFSDAPGTEISRGFTNVGIEATVPENLSNICDTNPPNCCTAQNSGTAPNCGIAPNCGTAPKCATAPNCCTAKTCCREITLVDISDPTIPVKALTCQCSNSTSINPTNCAHKSCSRSSCTAPCDTHANTSNPALPCEPALFIVSSKASKMAAAADHVTSDDVIDVRGEDAWRGADYPFENLVFSGGGIKGYAYIGAIKALEDAGIMSHVKGFAGSSAGAMCIACLAVGYDSQDITRFFYVNLKETFNDQQCACLCCVPKLYTRYGIHPAKRYYNGLGDILANKCGTPDITFMQLYERFGKELCIVVCNITKMAAEYCHHSTTPDLPIRQAVRMSMAVPFIYEPPVVEIDGQPNYYVDGSAGNHFPLHCFDGPNIGANSKAPPNKKTIGFYALSEKDAEHLMWQNVFGTTIPQHYRPMYLPDSKLALKQLKEQINRRKKTQRNFNEKAFLNQLEKFSHASLEHLGLRMKHYEAPNKTHCEATNIIEYIVQNLESLLISQVMSNLKPEDEKRTIPINCGYIESHDYEIEPADREFMLNQGYLSTRVFLQQYTQKHATTPRESVV